MIECDGGVTATPFRILAEANLMKGDINSAWQCLKSARDSVIWNPYAPSPRTYSITQDIVREEAVRCGCEIVDLPVLFDVNVT